MPSTETLAIESVIVVGRGQRVALAAELAKIYGVETGTLNKAAFKHYDA